MQKPSWHIVTRVTAALGLGLAALTIWAATTKEATAPVAEAPRPVMAHTC